MEIIERIGRDLNKFDIVLTLFSGGENSTEWAEQFVKSEELKKASKKTLLLSDMDLPCANLPYEDVSGCTYRRIGRDEAEELERFYRMYEFSDQMIMISDHPQYGGLLNYVKTGVMTLEEIIQTLLRK